jgi:hypothetical protein
MTGSLKWQQYTADNGDEYLGFRDESNGIAAGWVDVTVENQNKPILPSRFRPRYINVVRAGASGEDIRRKIEVGTLAKMLQLLDAGVIVLADGTYNIRSYRGEKRTTPYAIDTAQNDGTIT